MGVLGISLYPEKTTFKEDKAYIDLAHKHAFKRLFANLLFFKTDQSKAKEIIDRLTETIAYANTLGFESYIDVNPNALKVLNIAPKDIGYFKKLGAKGIRLDVGFTGREEAQMTRNEEDLTIEINMSNDDHYLERIFDYQPNRTQLVGCHNFFPQAYTGLSTDFFLACSERFREKGLRTAAFVTSQKGKIGPWPLNEGLCTLEDHRHLSIEDQVAHLKLLDAVDDIIIGNAYASEEELKKASEAFKRQETVLEIIPRDNLLPIEKSILFENQHSYRGDRSDYMVRSSMTRYYYEDSVPANNNGEPIIFGDVLLLNEQYAQYKGEIQLALRNRPGDTRINHLGKLTEGSKVLLKALKPYTDFRVKVQGI